MQICGRCSREYEAKAANQVYCSPSCSRKAQKARASARQREEEGLRRFKETGLRPGEGFCGGCGTKFRRKTNSSKYCSEECREIGRKKSADARYEQQKAERELFGPKLKRLDCIQCGKAFYSERSVKICSTECRIERAKGRYLRNQYGIEINIYDKMLKEQGARCLICDEIKRLVIDHCHESGRVRGLLCANCNSGLGLLGDDTNNLERAVLYLRNNGREPCDR